MLNAIGLHLPEILVPAEGIDLYKWAVVACDQFTSQPEYWQKAADIVGGAPSTLELIFPEAFLEAHDQAGRIRSINAAMQRYLDEGVLRQLPPGFMLVDRQTGHTPSRKGLVVALDLEQYDYRPGSRTLIRATEGTVVDRLPPRIRIRQDALLESPHIMVLIDDPQRTVIEPLFDEKLNPVYDTDLMLEGGHIRGSLVDEPRLIEQVAGALGRLADPGAFKDRYGTPEVMLYAMGDGNHSLATAREIWLSIKDSADDRTAIMNHPARYALVELVNVHDPGLEFEPIHRVVFDIDPDALLEDMQQYFQARGSGCCHSDSPSLDAPGNTHTFTCCRAGQETTISVSNPGLTLAAGSLQAFLDHYLQDHPQASIDYIHGRDVVHDLASRPNAVGFLLPAISKHDLFGTIIHDGALPRKTFSMGHAPEKRYYLECRRVR